MVAWIVKMKGSLVIAVSPFKIHGGAGKGEDGNVTFTGGILLTEVMNVIVALITVGGDRNEEAPRLVGVEGVG